MHKHRFMNNLSSDILKQNHHLKNQLIQVRKNMKQYQNKMIKELQSAGKIIQFKTDFLVYESAEQALNVFIKLVHEAMSKVNIYELNFVESKSQRQHLIDQNDRKSKKLNEQKQRIQKMQKNIQQKQQQNRQLSINLKKTQQKYEQQVKKSSREIGKLKLSLQSLDKELNLKYMLERKQIIQNSNKQIMKYRQKVQSQFTKHEKQLRVQIQKKDRQLKSLLFTMNSILGYKSKKRQIQQMTVQKQSSDLHIDNIQPSNQQIIFLNSVIKPFTDHADLNQRLSKLRKEFAEISQEKRNLSTKIVDYQTKYNHLNEQVKILQSKLSISNQKYEALCAQFQEVSLLNEKISKDIAVMQHYYENKWNDEFKSVKTNLQNKFHKKTVDLQDQYTAKKQQFTQMESKLNVKNSMLSLQVQFIQNRNYVLQQQNAKMQAIKQSIQKQLKQTYQILKQSQKLSNEDRLSLQYKLKRLIHSYQGTIQSQQQKIDGLNKDIETLKNNHQQQIIRLNQKHNKEIQSINQQHQNSIQALKQEKDNKISQLHQVIHQHKEVIQVIQREIDDKMKLAKVQAYKNKQEIIKSVKMQHLQQLSKYNQKILKLSIQVSQIRTKLLEEKQKFKNEEQKNQKLLQQKQYAIDQANARTTLEIAEKQSKNQQLLIKMQIIKKLEYRLQSLEILLKSHQLQIENLNLQIKSLVDQKITWKNDLNILKKQYEQGFKQTKQICKKRVNYYKSRIWELQRVRDSGFINLRERQQIRSLTEQKKNLQQNLNRKQAENLILLQVKKYYQNRTQEAESKLGLNYQLKEMRGQNQPIFIKKPQNRNRKKNIQQLKTEIYSYNTQFHGWKQYEQQQISTKFNNKTNRTNYNSDIMHTPKPKTIGQNNQIKKRLNSPINPAIISEQKIEASRSKSQFRSSSLQK